MGLGDSSLEKSGYRIWIYRWWIAVNHHLFVFSWPLIASKIVPKLYHPRYKLSRYKLHQEISGVRHHPAF